MYAGVTKLRENDNNVKRLQDEVDNDAKLANNVPTVLAEDTVSQVLMPFVNF